MEALETLESDTSKLVVLYLRRAGNATPDRIADHLHLRLTTVLSTLRHLEEKGLVRRLPESNRVVLAERGERSAPSDGARG
jgi:Mn-dependent DtxR family transcriptional regulator